MLEKNLGRSLARLELKQLKEYLDDVNKENGKKNHVPTKLELITTKLVKEAIHYKLASRS